MDTLTEARFWAKVNKNAASGCWEWLAHLHKGYGQFGVKRVIKYAHRVSYELLKGPIPAGLEIDHLCKNPKCVNPNHLEPVTRQENLSRIVSKPRGFVDLTGKRFTRWTAKKSVYDPTYKRWAWLCDCECGNIGTIGPYRLLSEKSTSCGCLKRERLAASWSDGRRDHMRQ